MHRILKRRIIIKLIANKFDNINCYIVTIWIIKKENRVIIISLKSTRNKKSPSLLQIIKVGDLLSFKTMIFWQLFLKFFL